MVIQLDENDMKQAVEEWPIAQVIVPLVSEKFPLDRALSYVRLRRPMVVNDLSAHITLRDRIATREMLMLAGIPVAKGIIYDSEMGDRRVLKGDVLMIYTRTGELRGKIRKPFVEKPADAENHEIYIYYASEGGARRLHRKVGDKSSQYLPNVKEVRKGTAYVYEEFHLPAMCSDVKVYGAGNYFYAESRKAPHIDGKVERDDSGLEIRAKVKLTYEEKLICQGVYKSFGQFMNGFDLLRTIDGKTFVIDVNGWSFVKRPCEFAPKCASKLIAHIFNYHSIHSRHINRLSFPSNCIESSHEPPTPAA